MQMRGIAHQEEQKIFLRLLWKFRWPTWTQLTLFFSSLHTLLQTPQIVELAGWPLKLLLFFRLIFTQQQIVVYMLLNGKGSIKKVLNCGFAMIKFVFGNTSCIDARLIDHTARG